MSKICNYQTFSVSCVYKWIMICTLCMLFVSCIYKPCRMFIFMRVLEVSKGYCFKHKKCVYMICLFVELLILQEDIDCSV